MAGALLLMVVTARWWVPLAARGALATRGVRVKNISWPTNGVWRFEGVDAKRNGMEFKAATVNTLTPRAWKRALREPGTNAPIFLRVDRWRLILPEHGKGGTNSVLGSIQELEKQGEALRKECPRALFSNGVIERAGGEFRSGVVEWKNGELAGDMTWPRLNDPADFRLKLNETGKAQFVLKQYALDLASKVTADGGRIFGYVRWKENRADFDLQFDPDSNIPRGGFLKSDGLQLPRELLKIPGVEQINARVRLAITNGQFNLKIGAPASANATAQEGG